MRPDFELHHYMAGQAEIDGGHYGFDFPARSGFPAIQSNCNDSSLDASRIPETAEAKAIAALRNHKHAEKRRRERINYHLDRLRALLPCNPKTNKATLLAKVVQRVRELKQQASQVTELEYLPSETDDFAAHANHAASDDGKLKLKASLCCDDRADLFSDLIDALNSLQLKAVRAEMSTLGGRIRNVLILSGDTDQCRGHECAAFLHNALKNIIERSKASERAKRRRRLDPINIS